jgi:Arc/MetJ-type ribon-helix-helix transcriptional regulator
MPATEKLAISLPKDLIDKLRRAREEGRIESVSGHIAELLRREDDWRDARATLDRIFEQCPEPEPEHYAWARRALGAGQGGRPPGTAAKPAT